MIAAELTAVATRSMVFAYVSGVVLLVTGIWLSWKRRRVHALLLVCLSAAAISWIEAPYDWAMYAQFPEALPRMPSWWPLNMTWAGGLPSSVPIGYMSYFGIPALIGAALGSWASNRFGWRRPLALLTVGLGVGFVWALCFNGFLGARLGVFYYGRVIPGLALFEGTKHQYPVYDAVAMALQMAVFAYILGRTDREGRNVVEAWAESKTKTRFQAGLLSVASVILVGHVLYLAVFAPHLITKLRGDVTSGPAEQLFPGIENQPLHGGG
jgi:hypothetical protein